MQIAPRNDSEAEGHGGPFGEEKASILIVDDLPEKLLVFQSVLEELGQNLVKVRSGAAALRELLKQEFAVILLDVNMPDIDGFETAALIRRHPRSALTPIIFITSYADEVQTAKGYSLGAVDYILSPVDPVILRSKVSVFVSLYLMGRQIRRQADGKAAVLAADAARRAAEENDRRSAFLAKASRELSGSLEAEVAMRHCAQLLVPEIAPAAVVFLSDPDFGQLPVCGALSEGAQDAVASWKSQTEIDPQLHRMLRSAIVSRQRTAHEIANLSWLGVHAARATEEHAVPSALLAVPLVIGERVLGAILVGAYHAGHWSIPTCLLLEEITIRATAAFENVRLYRVLQREVRERMAAQEELQESNRRKDEFLAMMSHELRNPLSSIKLAVEVVRRHVVPHAKVEWGLEVADRQLRQLTRLIEELLDVTRISQGKIVLQRSRLDMNAVIAHSIETVHGLIESRRQSLNVQTPVQPVWLDGDAARLTQVIANLLQNASKYSPEASVITVESHVEAGKVVVTVDDRGMGIDPELLPRIFDLFAQGKRGLDRAQGGLGVGLTLARRLTEMHDGQIEAYSDGRDKGSRFLVRLPLVLQALEPTAVARPRPQRAAGFAVHRILVVDDNHDAAAAIATVLEGEGHAVQIAQDGVEGLARLDEFHPQVVILDIGLPLLDGYEVARRIRKSQAAEGMLLIALTGYGQHTDRQKAVEAGFDFHFVKPAETDDLIACIHSWELGSTDGAGNVASAGEATPLSPSD